MMDFRDWQGKAVLDREGHKIGSIGQLYVDDRNSAPAWATIKTGAFGTKETFFPVSLAHVKGDDIVIDMPEDEVKNAPVIKADEHITQEEENQLFEYYREKWSDQSADDDMQSDNTQDSNASMDDADDTMQSDDMDDRSVQAADMAPAKRADNSDSQPESGRVHLRRYTVTEMVTEDGEVQRKEIIMESQPITDLADQSDKSDSKDDSDRK